ncbi:MAG: response regulator transcription factor [Verrucomicrobiae bacterium]|nr:response regulator transcription factor [Verrucomicrobiae bacterium]
MAIAHPLVLEGLKSSFSRNKKINVIGTASNWENCLNIIDRKNPDVALVDINLSDTKVDEMIQKTREKGCSVKFIIFSDCDNYDLVQSAIKAGACGYILKDSPIEEILNGIERVFDGHTFFSDKVGQMLLNNYVKADREDGDSAVHLSEREIEVLKLIAEGLTAKDIAVKLGISPRTVDTHRERIMSKLNIHTIAGLTRYAIKHRIVSV